MSAEVPDSRIVMPEAHYLSEVVIILIAAIAAVAIFQRLKLGPILGYLVAGIVIGPYGLRLVTEVETIHGIAELGVVFLLFTVGLELPFTRIKVTPMRVFLLGLAQILATAAIIAGLAIALGLSGSAAVVIGGGLALSSTAVVLRLLSDRGELTTGVGRSAFAILMVQDLAVGPLLIIVFALGQEGSSLFTTLAVAGIKAAVVLMAILGFGRIVPEASGLAGCQRARAGNFRGHDALYRLCRRAAGGSCRLVHGLRCLPGRHAACRNAVPPSSGR